MALTPKQKAFCDAYIENGGNATQAAITAGYSEKTAYSQGQRLLKNVEVAARVRARQAEIDSERIGTIKEIQELRTGIMRDEQASPKFRLRAASDLEGALNIKAEHEAKIGAAAAEKFELPARVISRGFSDINRRIIPNKTYVFKGGRGSGKSSYVALKIIELLKNNPNMHACAVRKVAATLRTSVYDKFKWAIHELGLDDEFKFRVSPLEIVRKTTGQMIYFRGCDDPMKLKSLSPAFGYIGILWKEEKDQLSGAEEERNINQSILRGGAESYDFSSYNPPKSKSNWVNKIELEQDEKRVTHLSTYHDVPPEWLGQKFINDAEHLKVTNPAAYEHEYMGVANGDGGNVFESIESRTITDEEISHFDRIYQGVDWGWYPDPYAFLRTYYDAARERIYLIDELYVNKQNNSQTGKWIIDRGYDDYSINCDSAEPKSVNDYRDMGLFVQGAVKGPGSVEYGFKWLQSRTFVIDPERTPNAYREIIEYEYERDRDGNVMSGYPDKNDHAISALRYAYEPLFIRRGSNA